MHNITKAERIKRKMEAKGMVADISDANIVSETPKKEVEEIKQPKNMEKAEKNDGATPKAEKVVSETKVSSDASDKGYSPFNQPVVEREYTKPNVETIGDMPDSIPIPEMKKRVIDFGNVGKGSSAILGDDDNNGGGDAGDDDNNGGGDAGDDDNNGGGDAGDDDNNGGSDYQQPKGDFIGDLHNPAMQDMSNKEAKRAANDMVDTILNGLEWVSAILTESCTISKTKLQDKALKGDFNMSSLQIPLSEEEGGGTIMDYFDNINEVTKDGFAITEEWKENVKNPLRDILLKHGIGITPEQQVLYYGVQLLLQWGVTFATIKTAHKQIYKALTRVSNEIAASRVRADGNMNGASSRSYEPTPPTQAQAQAQATDAQNVTIIVEDATAKKVPSEEEISEKTTN